MSPPRRVAIDRSTSPIMQTIAADPIEMKGSAAMTCPTKRRNSPIASHFGEKASPQRAGAPATWPPKPKQPQPQQQNHPNQSSPDQSKSPTPTRQARPKQQDHPNHSSTNHSNRTTKPKQHQPQNRPSPTLAGRAASPHHRNLGKVREAVRRAVFGTGTPLLLHGAFDRESDRPGAVAVVQAVNAFHQHIALRAVPHV